jgi:hypothetical protein
MPWVLPRYTQSHGRKLCAAASFPPAQNTHQDTRWYIPRSDSSTRVLAALQGRQAAHLGLPLLPFWTRYSHNNK